MCKLKGLKIGSKPLQNDKTTPSMYVGASLVALLYKKIMYIAILMRHCQSLIGFWPTHYYRMLELHWCGGGPSQRLLNP